MSPQTLPSLSAARLVVALLLAMALAAVLGALLTSQPTHRRPAPAPEVRAHVL